MHKFLSVSAAFGVLLFLIGVVVTRANFLTHIELLMFFGVAAVTPLALANIHAKVDEPLYKVAAYAQPIAALGVGVAFLLPMGAAAGLLALPWLFCCVCIALLGVFRWLPHGRAPLNEMCLIVGLVYAPISGVWVFGYLAFGGFLGFDPIITLLTGVHFCFISLGGLVLAGLLGRVINGNMYRVAAIGAMMSPALVAVGITVSAATTNVSLIEVASVVLLAASFLLVSVLTVTIPRRGLRHTGGQVMVQLSALSLLLTMAFALAYSIGRYTGWWGVSIPQMVQWHGWINAVGFVFLGLLGWRFTSVPSKLEPLTVPFSQLFGRGQIGADFFDRNQLIDHHKSATPTGIVDSLHEYDRPDFSADAVHPEIRAFYENTCCYDLTVYPEWHGTYRLLAPIYKSLSGWAQQMNFPAEANESEAEILSTIVPLDDQKDGRSNVRGWVRTYTRTQQAVYVAAYASHSRGDTRYMNIAFPLPFSNLTSILHINAMNGGVCLTSFNPDKSGDQGVYLVTKWVTARLPINEIIEVFPQSTPYDGFPGSTQADAVFARHRMWLFRSAFLTLHYVIQKDGS